MNTTVAQVTDPTRLWMFEDTYIRETLSREANRILKGAAVGLPEYPACLGILGGVPILARDVVVLADGSSWLYADDVPGGSVLTPGALGICHKCGDRGPVEGTFHVGWQHVIVEFAFCVGCMASHVAQAQRLAEERGGLLVVKERTDG